MGGNMNKKKDLNVKLIHCGNVNISNPKDNLEKNLFFMPMGLFALANILRENKFDIELIHLDFEQGKEITEILDFDNIDVVGFDCFWINQGLAVIETAKLIKSIKPEIFIFLGGFSASLFAEEIIKNYPEIDAVIRGDGEIPIVELCEVLNERLSTNVEFNICLNKVQNLVWRYNEDVVLNEFSYVGTSDLVDKLDFASIDLLRNWEEYMILCKFWTRFESFNSSNLFFLEVGRGCQFACTFCGGNCEAQRRMNNRKQLMVRSTDSVIDTIIKAKSFGFDAFYAGFEFLDSDKWYLELFNKIKDKEIQINYVHSSWNLMSESLIDVLSESCNQIIIEISPETGDEEVRKRNKDSRLFYTNAQLEAFLDYVSAKSNIKVQLYFGYFLAFDTKDAVFKTINYIMKLLIKYPDLLEIEYYNFSTDPGSLLFLYPEKYDVEIKVNTFSSYIKFIKKNFVERKVASPDMRLFTPKSIGYKEGEMLENKIKVFHYLFSKFRKSISYILQKNQNPNLIMGFLEEEQLSDLIESNIQINFFKDKLIAFCHKNDICTIDLIKIINAELEYQKSQVINVTKPVPQIYIDNNYFEDGNEYQIINSFIEFINNDHTKKINTELQIDFDI